MMDGFTNQKNKLIGQEKEAADTYEEWCTRALKNLKEASPLCLKVTLQSVSYLCTCL